MVTRGALREAQLRRGIIPHVGLHRAPQFVAGAVHRKTTCANKAVGVYGMRDRLIPVRHVNFHNAN